MSKEANASQPLIGRESTTVPGRFGEPLTVEHSVTSRGGFDQHATHPLFLCLHGWGSSEEDMADIMRLIAPYNDFVALRGPLTLAPAREGSPDPGNYAWFHDACLSAMIVTTTRMPPPQQSTDGWRQHSRRP